MFHGQQSLNSNGDQKLQDLSVRVITLAGENQGATMDLGSKSKNNDMLDFQRVNYKPNGANKNEESHDENHRHKAAGPVNAFVNSNIQAANNSILYHSTWPHRDPGVRLTLSNNPVSSKGIAPPKESRGKSVVRAAQPNATTLGEKAAKLCRLDATNLCRFELHLGQLALDQEK